MQNIPESIYFFFFFETAARIIWFIHDLTINRIDFLFTKKKKIRDWRKRCTTFGVRANFLHQWLNFVMAAFKAMLQRCWFTGTVQTSCRKISEICGFCRGCGWNFEHREGASFFFATKPSFEMLDVQQLLRTAQLESYELRLRSLGVICVEDMREMADEEWETEVGLSKVQLRRLRRHVGARRRISRPMTLLLGLIVVFSVIYAVTGELLLWCWKFPFV
jgi:hypothetical protein